MAFMDFEKTYNRVNRGGLSYVLQMYGGSGDPHPLREGKQSISVDNGS